MVHVRDADAEDGADDGVHGVAAVANELSADVAADLVLGGHSTAAGFGVVAGRGGAERHRKEGEEDGATHPGWIEDGDASKVRRDGQLKGERGSQALCPSREASIGCREGDEKGEPGEHCN